jgi:hypothetical protein
MQTRLLCFWAITLALVLLPIGCKHTSDPEGPPHVLTGTLGGKVIVLDWETCQVVDKSRVLVAFDNHSAKAFTDSDGTWQMPDLSAGTYDITFSKSGYSTYKQFGFHFSGRDSTFPDLIQIGGLVQFYVNSLTWLLQHDTLNSVRISGTISSPSFNQYPRWILLLNDTSASVSASHAEHGEYYSVTSIGTFSVVTIPPRGRPVYFVAYGVGPGDPYYDPNLGTTILPNLSSTSSPTIEVFVP